MITKKEIIDVLIDEGLSIIESCRCVDSKKEFREAIVDIKDKYLDDFRSNKL